MAASRLSSYRISATRSGRFRLARKPGAPISPPQTRSPAMILQGFTGWPLAVASLRHVTVTYAGLSLPASESRIRKFHRYA